MSDSPRSARTGGNRLTAAARCLLLGAVITGVLAMHILSVADSGGDHPPMAMTPGSGTAPVMSMSQSMPALEMAPPAYPVTDTKLSGGPGMGMSPMSCCILFLVSAAGLVLLMCSTKVATVAAGGGVRGSAAQSGVPQRSPPGPGGPRIALSVQRV